MSSVQRGGWSWGVCVVTLEQPELTSARRCPGVYKMLLGPITFTVLFFTPIRGSGALLHQNHTEFSVISGFPLFLVWLVWHFPGE